MKESETPDEDEHVWLLTVKGNLRHRIEKCGIEKPCGEEVTDLQRRLREVATAQQFEGKLGRPSWANGAFVFVTVAHAASIEDVMQEWMTKERPGEEMMSKYVIVSESLKDILLQALSGELSLIHI